MVDRNLFPYNLAVAAIFKDEARYIREWLDYHLLAGVEHFYLYNNESSDNYAEILKPYIDANIVTLIDWRGKIMQYPAYDDAVERFRFFCRYMAFIDIDEFIYPKTGQSIVDVADEVLSKCPEAVGLLVNLQHYGSNGHEAADYSKGVLERFTRRAQTNWKDCVNGNNLGNFFWKIVINPRAVKFFKNPHSADTFNCESCVNSDGVTDYKCGDDNIVADDKIVLNHYFTKSREEFVTRRLKGTVACWAKSPYDESYFRACDRNEVFDDGILRYRAARAENFSLPDDTQRFRRVENFLIDTLTSQSPFDAPEEFFCGKVETFLTCRRLAEHFGTRIGNRSAEEYALVWLYQTLKTTASATYSDLQLLLTEMPALLKRPFPLCRKILQVLCDEILPTLCDALRERELWALRFDLIRVQKFLMLLR
ncbi:MAG: glycosyltransferase family 92 protein [Selenomonadaceae bacterium]|nr:glycosyltransferase family 92 protein [Selenomonadaceae bacterium]